MKGKEKILAKKLFGVFETLRDLPADKQIRKFEKSNTSKILKNKKKSYFLARAKEEWAELNGVISGDHSHSGNFEKDFLLESSQVFYWLACASVVEKQSFEEFEKEFQKELAELEKLHKENKIPLIEILKKDLKECKEKGYL